MQNRTSQDLPTPGQAPRGQAPRGQPPRGQAPRGRAPRGRPSRRHRRWPWILAAVVVVIIGIIFGAVAAFIGGNAPAPLALPQGQAPPTGTLDGTWTAGTGTLAGFRISEHALGMSGAVAGRTSAVSGTAVLAGDRVTSARFTVDLTAITVNGKAQPQVGKSLHTSQYPQAVVTLAGPASLGGQFASGATVTAKVPGQLTLAGVTRAVTITVEARRSGPAIDVAGSIPVTFAGWNITGPAGAGWFGSLDSRGTAEFLLVLQRQ